jgi:hypothetical protein
MFNTEGFLTIKVSLTLFRCGLVAAVPRSCDDGGLQEETLIRPAGHIAKVLPEVVHAGRASTQEGSGHLKVRTQVL